MSKCVLVFVHPFHLLCPHLSLAPAPSRQLLLSVGASAAAAALPSLALVRGEAPQARLQQEAVSSTQGKPALGADGSSLQTPASRRVGLRGLSAVLGQRGSATMGPVQGFSQLCPFCPCTGP